MKKKKSKMGAPKKPVESVKGAVLQLRLNDAEKEAFSIAAMRDGKTRSDWIRDRLRRICRQELETAGLPVPFLDGKLKA